VLAMNKATVKGFTGELATPIKWEGPQISKRARAFVEDKLEEQKKALDEEIELAARKYLDHMRRKIPLLREHYKIAEDDSGGWPMLLITAMAMNFVPGFRLKYFPPNIGRRKVWSGENYLRLIADVEKLKRESPRKDSEACNILVQRAVKAGKGRYLPSKDSTKNQAAKTLANRLVEARNPKHNAFAKLLKKDIPDYDRFMIDYLIAKFEVPENHG